MFGNKDKENTPEEQRDVRTTVAPREQKVSSVIGERVSFNGTLKVEGSIEVHGEIEGSITCTDQLIVGKNGRVKADLDVGSAVIAGQVEGRVFAKERVELKTASHLKGDVHAQSFVIQDGCFFQGNCTMGNANKTGQTTTETPEITKPEKVA
jgi:cytoskeletal protein CcmA (bactofilin family)